MEHSSQAGADGIGSTATTTDADLSLRTLVSGLLADDPALAQSLGRLDLGAEQLLKLIQPHEAEIRRSATAEAEALSVAGAQLKRTSESVPPLKARRIFLVWYTKRSILLVVSLAAGAIAGLSLISAFPALLQLILRTFATLIEAGAIALLSVRRLNERYNEARRLERNKYLQGAGIDALNVKVATAREALARALVSRGLRPIVIRLRSERDQTPYTTSFRYISARGLSEVYDPAIFELETPSFQQVRRLLDNTPGGSIGLAGPRGTGKTTIMSSFVEGRSRRSDEKRGRAIRVSAPVDYVTRDFILYLFAELCESVLVPEPPFLRPYYADQPIRRLRGFSYAYAAPIGLVASGILAIWGLMLLLFAVFRLSLDSRYWIGPFLIVGAVVIAYLSRQTSVIMRRRDMEQREETARREYAARAQPPPAQAREGVSDEIAKLASQYLDVIRFQQTYTDGWSGSFTASAGIVQGAAGITGGTSYLRNLLSLPEIVDSFKDFVSANVADAGPVLIGIDELDKIEGGDKAQAFLNDVKSVFGVEQCYFLISISEDALANFERRGLPVRDAFDSALDDVVRVSPLDYPTALSLIRIRIVGLPEPYAALIYCLSGGLPRDLIRWARAFVVAKDKAGEGLAALCKAVLRDDLERKVSASIVALSNDSEAGAEFAIRVIGSLKLSTEPSWLLDRCDEILGSKAEDGHQRPPVPTSGDGRSQALLSGLDAAEVISRRVISQLFGYFYFTSTLIEVFTDDLNEDQFSTLTSDDGSGTVSQLAHARQCFSTNPWLAIDAVSAFRTTREFRRLLTTMPAYPESAVD